MKVSIDYSDGRFTMIPARARESSADRDYWEWYEAGLVEISDEEWERYALFLTEDAKWHNRIRELDEVAHKQREPLDVGPID